MLEYSFAGQIYNSRRRYRLQLPEVKASEQVHFGAFAQIQAFN